MNATLQSFAVDNGMGDVLLDAAGTTNINATVFGATASSPTGLTAPPRTFATVQDLESELVNTRVWIGFHYRNSVLASESLGTAVANWELQRNFRRLDAAG